MINTIFYFPQAKLTYSDYAAAVQNGEISGRTIVLDKTSGKIFNQGKEYGYSVQEIQNLIDTSIEENRFDPTELQTEISNLQTDLQTGISGLRADLQQLIINIKNQSFKGDKGEMSFTSNVFKRSTTKPNKPGANEGSFSDPVPSGWSDGVPAGTDSIWTTKRIFSSDGQYPQQASWEDVQLMSDTESFDVEFSPIASNPGTPTTNPNNWYDPTADPNADWANMIWMATRTKSNGVWGNWNVTKIKGEKGEKGDAGSEITFDDTEIRNAIATLNNTVAGEKSRLDGVINNLDNSIQEEVESLLDDATWVQNNFPEGSGSASNFGQQDVENYLQTIGVWSNDEVHNKTNAAWSKISQSVDQITSRVATLETNGVDTQSLSSTINQKIANGEIQLNLDNTYARKTTVDDVEQIIEWMYSGLRSSTGQDKTIAELTAAGKSGLTSAIADIRTQVNKLENGDYVATASVDAKVKDSISGMLATADGTTAAGQFFSNVGAALTAGLITEANLSTKAASAGLMASNDFTAASILAQVNDDTSNVKIKADKIELDGQTVANSISANNMTLTGHVQANDFQAGASNSLNIKTTGSKISFCDGATEKAYFILEGSGLQLYIMDNQGAWRKIDWQNWASATSYTVLNLYQHTGGDNAANAFTQKNVYVADGNIYNSPDTTSGTPTGTFYVKTTPWEFIDDAEQENQSTSVLYMGSTANYRAAYNDAIDVVNIHAPIFSEYIDTYVEVQITNGQLVYNKNSNKYNIARQYPTGGIIYESHPGVIGTSSIYNSSTPIFINVDSNLPNDDYDYMYMYNTFYNKLTRTPSDYITGTCVKKVNTFNDARTTSVFSFTEYEQ